MNPSAFKIFAISSFIRDAGMVTWPLRATNALRILVSISAIGSVITPTLVTSPACLHHAGNLPTVRQRPEANPAQPELPKHRPRPPTRSAAAVPPDLELPRLPPLVQQRLLGHPATPPPGSASPALGAARALPRRSAPS